jgi:hypothetical protein
MYFPRNWEFGSALSKLRYFGGRGLNPPPKPPPSVRHCVSPILSYSENKFFLDFQVLSGGNVKSPNTVPLDKELNSIKSRIRLRKMMYYLKNKILLIVLRTVCFLGPDMFPYVETEFKSGATSAPPLLKHSTRSKELSTLQQPTWPSWQRNV